MHHTQLEMAAKEKITKVAKNYHRGVLTREECLKSLANYTLWAICQFAPELITTELDHSSGAARSEGIFLGEVYSR